MGPCMQLSMRADGPRGAWRSWISNLWFRIYCICKYFQFLMHATAFHIGRLSIKCYHGNRLWKYCENSDVLGLLLCCVRVLVQHWALVLNLQWNNVYDGRTELPYISPKSISSWLNDGWLQINHLVVRWWIFKHKIHLMCCPLFLCYMDCIQKLTDWLMMTACIED